VIEGYTQRKFRAVLPDGHAVIHDVYTQGAGPVVMIMQELPGIGPETLRLADEFVQEGFTVVLPHLFGPLGKTALLTNGLRMLCMRREFKIFEKGGTSPAVAWLRALCRDLNVTHEVEGVAVIGMCLTGNFAMSLMADEAVLAGVASQPSLPILASDGLHLSEAAIAQLRQRLETHGPMRAYRFAGDTLCTAEKFDRIEETFNGDRTRVQLKTLPGKGHAVLTLDFVDEVGHPTRQALDEVLSYFRKALKP